MNTVIHYPLCRSNWIPRVYGSVHRPRTEGHGRQRRYSIDYVQREQYFFPLVTRKQLCNVVHPVLGVLVHNVCNVRDYVCAL